MILGYYQCQATFLNRCKKYNTDIKANLLNTLTYRIEQLSMQNLSESQYEAVLKIMERKGIEDFGKAYAQLKSENAQRNENSERRKKSHLYQEQDMLAGELIEQEEEQQRDEELNKMREYLLKRIEKRKKRRVRLNNCEKLTKCCVELCGMVAQKLVPQLIKRKIIRSHFFQIYQDESVIQLKHKNLEQAKQALSMTAVSKALLIIISRPNQEKCIVKFLKKKRLLNNQLKNNFEVIGMLENEFEEERSKGGHHIVGLGNRHIVSPLILVSRVNELDELEIVSTYQGEDEILSIDERALEQMKEKIKQAQETEKRMITNVTNRLFQASQDAVSLGSSFVGLQAGEEEEEQQYDEDEIVNQPWENIQEHHNKMLARTQNQQYLKMVEENKIKEEKQKKRQAIIEDVKATREAQRMSIPEEPAEGASTVKIIFRCPNGDNKERNFDISEKIELLFSWVNLNEEIEFEEDDETKIGQSLSEEGECDWERSFDLLYSYPPQSLKGRQKEQLSSVFEQGQAQIKVLIKQI